MTDKEKIAFLTIALQAIRAVTANQARPDNYARTVAGSVAVIALDKLERA